MTFKKCIKSSHYLLVSSSGVHLLVRVNWTYWWSAMVLIIIGIYEIPVPVIEQVDKRTESTITFDTRPDTPRQGLAKASTTLFL